MRRVDQHGGLADRDRPLAPRHLDHFSFDSNATFRQKFLVHTHWRHNRSGPLLLYFGNEGAIEDFWNASGALFELAPPLNALVVALEHRYYGASLP